MFLIEKENRGEDMREKIIFATTNEGKMKEIRMILQDLNYDIISMKEAGIQIDIVEDGKTFEENAIIKAKTIMELSGEIVLADDSGLEVDAMDKAPGIYSARFMGEDTSYDIKNQFIIDKVKGLSQSERSARFVCAIACAFPSGEIVTSRGTIEGYIGNEILGENGFGYDPIFMVSEYGCTTAQLSPEIKNKISHRGKALEAMKEIIRSKK
jgi:XTP/dITP diphosphohydrolase